MPSILDELIIKVGATADFSKVESKIARVRDRLDGLGAAATKVGAGLTAAAGGTLFAFAEYEKGFAEMAAKTGKSMAALEASYGSAVKGIARQTGVSITDVQAGFQKGLSAGLEGKALIDAVTQATKSQAAGIGRLEDTISSATTAWSVLGVDADKAMNIITSAAQVGEGETEHFGQSLKGLVGQGATLGIEYEELAGALAAVSQSAKTVTVGETQMIAFLKAIASPAKGAVTALEELSAAAGMPTSFGDIRSTIRSQGIAAGFAQLKDVMFDLEKAGVDTAPAIAALFPSVEAQQFFNTVDPAKIAELTGAIAGSGDSIGTAFDEGETTVSRQMARTKESLRSVATAIGETLVPALTSMTEWLGKAVDWFEKQDPWLKEMVGQVLAAGPALLAVGVGLKTMQGVLGPLATLLRAHPLLLLLGAAALAYVHWDKIVALFEKAWQWLQDIFEKPANLAFTWVSDLWNTAIDTVKGTWQGLLDTITSGPADIFAWIQNAWRRVVDAMVEFLPSTIRDWLGLETLSDAMEELKEIREEALDDFEDARDEIEDFNEDFGELGVTLKLNPASADDLIDDIDDQMQAVRDRLPSSDAKTGPLSDLTAAGKGLVDTFAKGVREAAPAGAALADEIARQLDVPPMLLDEIRAVIASSDNTGRALANELARQLDAPESVLRELRDIVEAPRRALADELARQLDAPDSMLGQLHDILVGPRGALADMLTGQLDAPDMLLDEIRSIVTSSSATGRALADELAYQLDAPDAVLEQLRDILEGPRRALVDSIASHLDAPDWMVDEIRSIVTSSTATGGALADELARQLDAPDAVLAQLRDILGGARRTLADAITGQFDGPDMLLDEMRAIILASDKTGRALADELAYQLEAPEAMLRELRNIVDPAAFDSEVLTPIIHDVLDFLKPEHDLAWVVRQVGYDLEDEGHAIPANLAEIVRQEVALQGFTGLADPLPLGPPPPAPASSGGVTLNITLGEGAIRIDAPGADAQEIASRLGDALAEEMRALAEEVDGNALA